MKVLDLFCGSGGLSFGFTRAGFDVVDAVDMDKAAIETFAVNHPKTIAHQTSVEKFIKNYSTDVDVIIGGPPCQGFSAINPSRNLADPRNTGVDYFILAVEKLRPKYFVMENVTGIMSLGKGEAFSSILNEFERIGYLTHFKVLQAAHYGVPQSRWRLILFGALRPLSLPEFPQPTHAAKITPNFKGGNSVTFQTNMTDMFYAKHTTVWDAISDLPKLSNGEKYEGIYTSERLSQYQTLLRKGCNRVRNHHTNKLGELQFQRVLNIKNEGENWKNLPVHLMPDNLKKMLEKYGSGLGCNQRFGRLSSDGLFSTILTSPHLYWGAFIHPSQDRVISVREAARAQSFPDSYVFTGTITKQYEQVGNAVPPLLAEKMGYELMRAAT